MSNFLPFIVIGFTTGSVYALAATGLVLTYRTSRILNFAHGSMATVGVLLFYALVSRAGIPWQLAVFVTIVGVAPALGIAFEGLARRLSAMPTEAKVLATIGLVLFVQGGEILWGSHALGPRLFIAHPSLPGGLVAILGVNVGVDQIIIMGVGLVMAFGLHLVLEHTGVGRSMRAVVDNPELLALTGSSPTLAQMAGWALGIGFVTLSGLLLVLSPSNDVTVGSLFLLVLQAFGAAAIGGFRSLPLTYLGGILVGVGGALSTKYITEISFLRGLPPSLPFLVLFVVLVAVPRHLARERAVPFQPPVRRVVTVPRIWQWPLAAVVTGALVAVPVARNVHLLYVANDGLGYAILFLGLTLLVRTSGQVSLCQMGLAAVGATVFAHLAGTYGLPWFAALVVGGLAGAAVGAVVAIPAIRVAGIYLAVATLGFGVLLEQMGYATNVMFGFGVLRIPRPVIGPLDASNDATFYVVMLALFLCALALTAGIRRARLGRLLRALGDSPVALMTQGTTINITKVAVFCVSAFFAAIGGALITAQGGFLAPEPFASINSLTVVVVVLTLRIGQPLSALAAAAAYAVVPSFLNGTAPVWWIDIGFGSAAVLTAVSGSAGWLPRWRWAPRAGPGAAGLWRRRPFAVSAPTEAAVTGAEAGASVPEPAPAAVPAPGAVPALAGLEVRDLSVRFRAVVAVDDVTLTAPMGRITGLIGPNGAGKTTTFNFCSGLVQGSTGRLLLHGRDVTSTSPAARARHGLGRTFQLVDLFASLTVRENVELGREGAMAGAHLLTHVVAAPGQPAQVRAAATAAMELVGISALAEREIGTLSTGEKRLVELARCLAGSFDVLLLDEPSAGLDTHETRRFSEALRRVVRERGVGVLLVEHDMAMVMAVCDHLYVLDFGRLIFSGSPAETMASDVVRAAYLGVGQDAPAPAGIDPGPR